MRRSRLLSLIFPGGFAVLALGLLLQADFAAAQAFPGPAITPPGNQVFTQGQTILPVPIVLTGVRDSDGALVLGISNVMVSVTGLPAGLEYDSATEGLVGTVANNVEAMTYMTTISATFRLSEEQGGSTQEFQPVTFDIAVLNAPPVIPVPAETFTFTQGETVFPPITVQVTDIGNDLPTVTVVGLPDGLSHSLETSTAGAPAVAVVTVEVTIDDQVANNAEAGTYTVTIAAGDGASTPTATFQMTVNDAPPEITDPGDFVFTQGETVSPPIPIVVTDIADDLLMVTVDDLPAGLEYDPEAESVGGTVENNAEVRAYTAIITAGDGVSTPTVMFDLRVLNALPVITVPTEILEFTQGQEILPSITITVTDIAGDLLTVTVDGLPDGLDEPVFRFNSGQPPGGSEATVEVTGRVARNAQAGDYTVTVTANDGANSPTATFQMTVTNVPPVFTNLDQINGRSVTQGRDITPFVIHADDTDPVSVTVDAGSLPVGLVATEVPVSPGDPALLTGGRAEISGTVNDNARVGDYIVMVMATDEEGAVASTFLMTVEANAPPEITGPGGFVFTQGQMIEPFQITVTDDGDPLTVTVTNLPNGLNYNAETGNVGGTVARNAPVQIYSVRIMANDGVNSPVTEEAFDIEITNAPPDITITEPGNRIYKQSQRIEPFNIEVIDSGVVTVDVGGLPSNGLSATPDNDQPLTINNDGMGMIVVSGTVRPNAPIGVTTVVVTATDEMGESAMAEFTITLIDAPPDITHPGDQEYDQGETVVLQLTITNTGTDARKRVAPLPSGLIYTPRTDIISGTVASDTVREQDYTVVISVNDQVNPEVQVQFTMTITNRAPVITVPENIVETTQAQPITAFPVTVTDNDAVTADVAGLPAGLNYDLATGMVSGTVDNDAAAGDYLVTVTANDGVNDPVVATFTMRVNGVPPVITMPPADRPPGYRFYSRGQTITPFRVVATDNNAVTVTVTGLPAGLTYDPKMDGTTGIATGAVSGTVDNDADLGGYTVTISAYDGETSTVMRTFQLRVSASEAVITVDTVGGGTLVRGETIFIRPGRTSRIPVPETSCDRCVELRAYEYTDECRMELDRIAGPAPVRVLETLDEHCTRVGPNGDADDRSIDLGSFLRSVLWVATDVNGELTMRTQIFYVQPLVGFEVNSVTNANAQVMVPVSVAVSQDILDESSFEFTLEVEVTGVTPPVTLTLTQAATRMTAEVTLGTADLSLRIADFTPFMELVSRVPPGLPLAQRVTTGNVEVEVEDEPPPSSDRVLLFADPPDLTRVAIGSGGFVFTIGPTEETILHYQVTAMLRNRVSTTPLTVNGVPGMATVPATAGTATAVGVSFLDVSDIRVGDLIEVLIRGIVPSGEDEIEPGRLLVSVVADNEIDEGDDPPRNIDVTSLFTVNIDQCEATLDANTGATVIMMGADITNRGSGVQRVTAEVSFNGMRLDENFVGSPEITITTETGTASVTFPSDGNILLGDFSPAMRLDLELTVPATFGIDPDNPDLGISLACGIQLRGNVLFGFGPVMSPDPDLGEGTRRLRVRDNAFLEISGTGDPRVGYGGYALAAMQVAPESAQIPDGSTPVDAATGGVSTPPRYAETGVFDFHVSGVGNGGLASVVIPLARAVEFAGARLRKYTGEDGWNGRFTTGAIAPLDDYYGAPAPCPGLNAQRRDDRESLPGIWRRASDSGMNVGDECLLVEIQDGRINDADRLRNGVIHDPSALSGGSGGGGGGGGGGSTGGGGGGGGAMEWGWLLILAMGFLVSGANRRRTALRRCLTTG